MIWARILLFLMGPNNRKMLDDMTSVLCGTMKNYDLKGDSRLLDLLVHRWYSNERITR